MIRIKLPAALLTAATLIFLMVSCGETAVSQDTVTETAATTESEYAGYACPDFTSRDEGAAELRALIESVPRGYRAVYDYDSQEDFNLIQREISGKYDELSLDEIKSYYPRTLAAIDALALEYNDVPQIFITTGEVGWEYSDAKIIVTGDDAIVGDAARKTDFFSSADVSIKLRGNSSSSVDKKSYTIKFAERTSLLGMDYGKKWTLLANPFDKTLMRVKLCFDYAAALGLPYSSQTEFADVWLNGDYMGVYVLIEPVSEGKGRVDVSCEDGDFIIEKNNVREEGGKRYITTGAGLRFEINEPSEADGTQLSAYGEFFDSAEQALFTLDHTQYEQYFDLESFVNFYIFEEVIKDVDFAEYSTRYFVKDGKLYAGPPWDCDLTLGNVSYCEPKYLTYNNSDGMGDGSEQSTHVLWARRDWYEWLCRDEYFMSLVADRWKQVYDITVNLATENSLGESRIDALLDAYGDVFRRNFSSDGAGWSLDVPYGPYETQYPYHDYTDNVEELRAWISQRAEWLDGNISSLRRDGDIDSYIW